MEIYTKISRVDRTKQQARRTYDIISGIYDYLTVPFEKEYKDELIKKLQIAKGEKILEIGFGTGNCLIKTAKQVGKNGRVVGVDISNGMLKIAREKIEKQKLQDIVKIKQGDVLKIKFQDNSFDIVFMSFTLELFDTPELPIILQKIKRILKPEGKIGILSLSKENNNSILLHFYEALHRYLPFLIDCRPIYVKKLLEKTNFKIKSQKKRKLFGLPIEIVIASKKD